MALFSRRHGSGDQALIILHGLLGSSANWQSLAKRFGQKLSVYTLDLRNHGQSPWSDTMDYPTMATDVAQFIGSLDHRQCYILGHSMGGKVAMQLALNQPNKLDALIVADIAPVAYSHDYDDLIKALLAINLNTLENRAQADDLLKRTIPEVGIRTFLLHNLAFHSDRKQWYWRPNLPVLLSSMDKITSFDERLSKPFDKPTLFIHGANSDYVHPEHFTKIRQLFSQTQIQQLEQAGHWLHAEQPHAFLKACEQFLLHTH